MYRPKSLSQLLIYSSKVRSIQFVVPHLQRDDKWNSEPSFDLAAADDHHDITNSESSSAFDPTSAQNKTRSKSIVTLLIV